MIHSAPAITLTPHGLFMAGIIGVSRQVKGASKVGRYGVKNSTVGWQYNCDGVCGEMVLAKWLNVFYDGSIGNFKAKDAGDYQARATSHKLGHLLLHPPDAAEDRFVLVLTHAAPVFTLFGWISGKEGKLQKYWREGEKDRPAFFVPQSVLQPMDTLLC